MLLIRLVYQLKTCRDYDSAPCFHVTFKKLFSQLHKQKFELGAVQFL